MAKLFSVLNNVVKVINNVINVANNVINVNTNVMSSTEESTTFETVCHAILTI